MPVPEGEAPQTLEEAGIDSLTGLIEDGFNQAVRDIWDFGTDLPGFVAREGPESPPAALVKPILRAACRSYARGGGPQNLPGFDGAWGGICQPYLEDIGEAPIPGTGISRPFSGGQCPGKVYNINWSWSAGSFNSGPQSAQRPGPLTFSRAGTGSLDCGPGGGTYNVFTLLSQGTPISLAAGCGASLTSLSVTPVDGVDECGDPPPEYDPPKVKPGLPSVPSFPVDIPGVGPVNVDVTFDPDGTVNVNLPDVGIEIPIEDPFGLNDDDDSGEPDGPASPSDGPPGDVGDPGTPALTEPGGEAEGVAPEGAVLTGIRCQILAFPDSRNKYTDEVYRGAYYAYMGVPGLLDLDFGGAMVREDQFLFAEKDNLTAWRVRANTNYVIRTTPYYRSVE